jgi:5-formyltetrahydrofolate cyclo-ligase
MSKQPIRNELLLQRKLQEAGERRRLSRRAQELLLATAEFSLAAAVALYRPVQGEVLTDLLAEEAHRLGKRLLFPRVHGRQLELVEMAAGEEFRPGPFGVPEPSGDRLVRADAVDLLVVPGVVFDRAGHRLGYGKGFYDRLLHGAGPGCKAGMAFAFQLVAELPVEGHDVRMDLLVTESELLRWP